MTTMEVAMKKAMKVPPRTERIFNYVKDHPEVTAETVRKALKMEASSVSSLLCQLEQRKMLSSTDKSMRVNSSNGRSMVCNVAHYTSTISEYELLPKPKKLTVVPRVGECCQRKSHLRVAFCCLPSFVCYSHARAHLLFDQHSLVCVLSAETWASHYMNRETY